MFYYGNRANSKIDAETRGRLQSRHALFNLLLFFINPIVSFSNLSVQFTSVYTSPWTHFIVWHFFASHFILSQSIFYPLSEERNDIKNNRWCLTFVYHLLLFASIYYVSSEILPRVQKLWNIQLGFIGSLVSSWCLMFAYITVDLDGFYLVSLKLVLSCNHTIFQISRCVYHVSTFFLFQFFLLTTSYLGNVYIDIPSENRMKPAFLFGSLHVLFGCAVLVVYTKFMFNITICLFLVILSFMFSLNSYNYSTVNSYLLCEHRRWKWDFQESKGIICHVIRRRRHLSKILDSTIYLSSQKGYFQYDDDIQLDQKYYKKY
ncbi:hypothetical protein CRE_13997 [Caenorhabditis remanei]|uniref:Uncharacterized protein n=1 Tax=Caenorhabditis remanei TaxID=31234 RepID=E3M8Q4_CAERE|nr:hypothetical protein CRE_13997 [Caenorhabditis remanei]